jgi:MFS family permease
VLGLGLAALAWSPDLVAYFASWVLLGVGMGMGLYDAAFATLGHTYGAKARSAITALTLIAGFSSTICWPFSAFLVETYGWRAACLVYAVIHLGLSCVVHLALVPRAPEGMGEGTATPEPDQPRRRQASKPEFYVLALALTLIAVISAIMPVHLINLLRGHGLELSVAVRLAALLGPSQVGARLIEMLFGRHYHPTWTLILASGLIAVGLALLLLGLPPVAAVVLYGGGVGIAWIARGTVPLAIFGSRDYAARMGRLALPSLIAQALSPSVGAVLLSAHGAAMTLAMLLAAALLAVSAALWLQRANG